MNRTLLRRLALSAILAVAGALRLWRLDQGGVIVGYYFAGVRSMLESRHNFFFNAFDPAGFVSLDKPPVAFWLQTLSAKFIGFSEFSVLLPQAIEGLVAIGVLYLLVRRQFGIVAGLLAALFLALNPVSVAVDRSNNTESCLVLAMLLAVWALFRALDTGRVRWLIAASAFIGIGFNIKMLVAIGIVPVFALVYLIWGSQRLARRIGALAAAAGVLAAVSLSWCLAYDLTPPDSRPFVDSSPDNSMLALAVGHNFVQRFVRPTRASSAATPAETAVATAQPPYRDYAPAGPWRLVAPPLAGQIGWLFPLAAIGCVLGWRRPQPREERALLTVWVGWTLVYGAVFSAAGGLFHAYYLAAMAPPVCALAAIGAVRGMSLRGAGYAAALVVPVAIVLTALWQAYVVDFYLAGSLAFGHGWLLPALLGVAFAIATVLAMVRSRPAASLACRSVGLAVLLAMPSAWSLGTCLSVVKAGFPSARPPFLTAEAETRRGRFNEIAGAVVGDPKLIQFLEQNRGGERYLLAAVNARLAAPIIIATGAPVMALGGFNGRAPILGVEEFASLVAANQVRYALIGDGAEGLRRIFGEGGQRALTEWIRDNGRIVDPEQWRSAAGDLGGRPAESVGAILYDLRPRAVGS
jgi:4-amino-4-deoxy-L-arabinose transferase-like glycosyltransferase